MTTSHARSLALFLGLAAFLACSGSAVAQDNRPDTYTLELTTDVTAMPFSPEMLAALAGLPNAPDLSKMLAAKRRISGVAMYPTAAVEPIFVTVPADLSLPKNRLVLRVAKPSDMPGGGPNPPAPWPGGTPAIPTDIKITSVVWWRCGEARGPLTEVITMDDMKLPATPRGVPGGAAIAPEDITATLRSMMAKTASGAAEVTNQEVVGRGAYALNRGSIEMPLDGFLPAVKMVHPGNLSEVNLADGFDVDWEPVAGARGYLVRAMQIKGLGEAGHSMILWVSTVDQPPNRVWHGYEQETSIADDLAGGVLLSPDTRHCMVPPGIFDEKGMFSLTITAVGNDYYDNSDGCVVRGKIRSTWTGHKMQMMGGFMPTPGR